MAKVYKPRYVRLATDEYMIAYWFIRGYRRRKEEAAAILEEGSAPPDGTPRGSGISNPAEQKALKRIELQNKNEIVEDALLAVPPEYRRAVWENVMDGKRYPPYAHRSTYSRYRALFIETVYKKLQPQGKTEAV